MLTVIKSTVLGIVQGLTEFLPVSSSGHLVLVPKLFGWTDHWLPGTTETAGNTISTVALSFSVAVHVGTLVSLLFYFRKEWIALIRGFFTSLRSKPAVWNADEKLAWLIILATIPAGLVGVTVGETIESHMSTPFWIAISLLVISFLMVFAERIALKTKGLDILDSKDSLTVGLMQCLALSPGVSRSGITIVGGLFRGLTYETAARFAFLISAPIMAATGIYQGFKLFSDPLPDQFISIFLPGLLSSAVVGFLAIRFMLSYLQRGTLKPFVIYRIGLAVLVFAWLGAAAIW